MAERITISQLAERVDTGFKVVADSIAELKNNQNNFPRNDILDLRFKEIESRLLELATRDKELELSIEQSKRKSRLQVWITGSMSAAFGSLLTFLVLFFLTHLGK